MRERARWFAATVVLLVGTLTCRGQEALNIPDAQRVEVPKGGATVQTQDVGGRPTVEVRINGRGPFVMIVDTGASATVIDSSLVTELNLPRALTSAIPASLPGPVLIDELWVGDAVLHGVTVAAGAAILSGLSPTPPRGVLSAEAFVGNLLTLDYPHKLLHLEPGALPAADNQAVFQYAPDEVLPVIPVTVAGHTYRVHLDSGSPAALMLPMKYETEVPLVSAPVIAGHARTPAGEFDVFRAPFSGTATIGAFPIALPTIAFSDLRPGPAPGIGNVGAQVLQTFAVTVDATNRRIRFARPER